MVYSSLLDLSRVVLGNLRVQNVWQMLSSCIGFSLLMLLCFAPPEASLAQTIGHYPPGVEGIKNGIIPPPGHYTRWYNFYYYADKLATATGADVNTNFRVFAYVTALRHIWITENKVLGADLGLDLTIPFVLTDLNLGPIEDRRFGLGDIFLEPVILGWHLSRWDFAFAYGIFFPSGDFKLTRPASPGRGFWTHLLAFGITYHLDAEKTWTFSTAQRFEFHTENKKLNLTPGIHYSLEWSLSKALKNNIEVGLTGFVQRQLTDDTGRGVVSDPNIHDQIFGVGPEVGVFFPGVKMHVGARILGEFGGKDRPQGLNSWLALTRFW